MLIIRDQMYVILLLLTEINTIKKLLKLSTKDYNLESVTDYFSIEISYVCLLHSYIFFVFFSPATHAPVWQCWHADVHGRSLLTSKYVSRPGESDGAILSESCPQSVSRTVTAPHCSFSSSTFYRLEIFSMVKDLVIMKVFKVPVTQPNNEKMFNCWEFDVHKLRILSYRIVKKIISQYLLGNTYP